MYDGIFRYAGDSHCIHGKDRLHEQACFVCDGGWPGLIHEIGETIAGFGLMLGIAFVAAGLILAWNAMVH